MFDEDFLLSLDVKMKNKIPTIIRYEVHDKCTIVWFKDGSKTVSKCADEDQFSLEQGIMMCILKKLCGDNIVTQVQHVIKREENFKKMAYEYNKAVEAEKIRIENKRRKSHQKYLMREAKRQAQFELMVEEEKKKIKKK